MRRRAASATALTHKDKVFFPLMASIDALTWRMEHLGGVRMMPEEI